MRETLPVALKLTFGDEGGYSNRATDKGGPTKYGITLATLSAARGKPVTAADVSNLTIEEAEDIYRKGYWAQSGGDLLPRGLDYFVFNNGVMSGPARAVKILQKLITVTPDGNVGVQTVNAAKAYPGGLRSLILDYSDAYMAYLKSISGKQGFPSNGRGWTIRITGVDPLGKYAPRPGVVGNAIKIAFDNDNSAAPLVSAPAPDGGDAKAVPDAPNPWIKPEVLGPIGGVLPGVAALVAGPGPLQWVLAAGVLVGIGLGAYYAFRRIQKTVV